MSNVVKAGYSNFSAKDAEEVYSKLKTEAVTTSMLGLTMAIAAVLIITEIWKIYQEAYQKEHGRPDMRDFMKLISKYMIFLGIISALPFIISLIEKLLTFGETALLSTWGDKPDIGFKVLEKETQLAEENLHRNLFGLTDPLNLATLIVGIDYASTALIKPILYFLIKHLYIGALFGRYAYLILLEIVAPLAIVCLISEKTQQHFFTWFKHMIVCYLLIPAFMLADALSNCTYISLSDHDRYTFIPMIMVFILKLYLFAYVTKKLNNLL